MKNIFSKKGDEIKEEYMRDEITKIDGDDVEVVMDKEEDISKKISNAGFLEKYTELAKVMFGMLKDYRKGIYTDVPWFTIASIAFGFLYVLNPLDIIPDFIPGLGYIDDMAVLTFGLRFIETDLHKYLDWKLESDS